MVDRVYKQDLPRLRKELKELENNFLSVDSQTDWAKQRIEPLLKHVETLEGMLDSPEFSRSFPS